MGFLDELKKLTKSYNDEEDDYDYEDDARPAREKFLSNAAEVANDFDSDYGKEPRRAASGSKVVNIHTTAQMQVVLVKPDRFDNVSDIADHLRSKHAVVLNLEQTNKDVARRLVDFLSGCAYALDGKIKKIALSTYIITPYNVDIVGDLIDELENSGLYL